MIQDEQTQGAETVPSVQAQLDQIPKILEDQNQRLEELDESLDNCRTIADNCEERLQGVPTDELSELDVEALVELVSLMPQIKNVIEKFPELAEAVLPIFPLTRKRLQPYLGRIPLRSPGSLRIDDPSSTV